MDTPKPHTTTTIADDDDDKPVRTSRRAGAVQQPATISAARPLITLEPALLLLFTSFSLCGTIWTNQIIYQTCTVRFGYAADECALLGTPNASHAIETEVQPYAARILMTRQLIESIAPALLALFIGPWSDRFGRRPVILAAMAGYLCSNVLSLLVAWLSAGDGRAAAEPAGAGVGVSPWAYVVAAVPVALTGGYCSLLTGMFCYMADVTGRENRAMR